MKDPQEYDGETQMFKVMNRAPIPERLRFFRHLAEKGLLEHPVQGPISGPFNWAQQK